MTMLPSSAEFTGATVTEGAFKTALAALRTFLYEKLGDDGSVAVQAFPAGTLMLFQQTSAPTGWTKQTTHNDKALRVVSGTASSGGNVAFSTVFGRTTTDGHALTTAQMPAHTHDASHSLSQTSNESGGGNMLIIGTGAATTGSAGSGGAHSHNIDLRVHYVDLIIASKNA